MWIKNSQNRQRDLLPLCGHDLFSCHFINPRIDLPKTFFVCPSALQVCTRIHICPAEAVNRFEDVEDLKIVYWCRVYTDRVIRLRMSTAINLPGFKPDYEPKDLLYIQIHKGVRKHTRPLPTQNKLATRATSWFPAGLSQRQMRSNCNMTECTNRLGFDLSQAIRHSWLVFVRYNNQVHASRLSCLFFYFFGGGGLLWAAGNVLVEVA